jgi:hypothetical protein
LTLQTPKNEKKHHRLNDDSYHEVLVTLEEMVDGSMVPMYAANSVDDFSKLPT